MLLFARRHCALCKTLLCKTLCVEDNVRARHCVCKTLLHKMQRCAVLDAVWNVWKIKKTESPLSKNPLFRGEDTCTREQFGGPRIGNLKSDCHERGSL